jgi:hypothetical protein
VAVPFFAAVVTAECWVVGPVVGPIANGEVSIFVDGAMGDVF